MAETTTVPVAELKPRDTIYCAKCATWLEKHHPTLHASLYSDEAIAAAASTLSVDARKRAEKDAAKKASKAAATEQRDAEKRATSKVQIKRVERNKRKYVTCVQGLEAHGLELKKVAKDFGRKFATGSSVTKLAGGLGEEIVVQGDVSEEVEEFILEHYKDVPEDNIELVEDKPKKKGPPIPPPQ